jgi:hypothetical protein
MSSGLTGLTSVLQKSLCVVAVASKLEWGCEISLQGETAFTTHREKIRAMHLAERMRPQ